MAKRRATVSLRKPSPAPEVEAPAASAPISTVALVESEPASITPAPIVSAAVDSCIRPPPPEVMTVEAFVNGAAAALERMVGDVPQAKLIELLGRGPAGYRELTVYLPEQLARDLSLHCMDRNLDMNRIVASALERHLINAPVKLGRRRIAALARALIIVLTRRARSFLSRRGWQPNAGEPAAAAG